MNKIALALALLLPGAAMAQQPPVPQTPPPGGPPAGTPGGPPGGVRPPVAQPGKPRPYAEVITKDAKSDEGLFTTHQIDDKWYWEIPKNVLGKDILWNTDLERSQSFYGFGQTEIQDRTIRLEKRGDKLLLRAISYDWRADDPAGDVSRSLEKGRIEPILAIYDILAYGKDESMVIDARPVLFGEMSGVRFDQTRSFIDKLVSYKSNVTAVITGTSGAPASPLGGGGGATANTQQITHSIVLLPEKPMKPRLFDSRVGWFATGFNELGGRENRVKEVVYINRWRLEKKDPSAAISEPVTPITYYLGPEIPEKWKKFVKAGVEAWNPAFEKAGFKNAVVCREMPTREEDPEFELGDIRYTVIRWLPSGVGNAYGPSIVDPRTGEILNGSPKMFHEVMNLAQNWYFVQAGPSDPRAKKLPLPDDLMGKLIGYVVTHEIGHTLGFPHNMKSSSTVPIKLLRDPAWTAKYGTAPSVMDYARNNYVAQPGDKVSLVPKVSIYDNFAVEWGYKPIPQAATPQAEKPYLNRLAEQQITNPMLRFGNPSGEDPGRQTEDLGEDGVEATRLGLINLRRVMGYLESATTKPGDDYTLLGETYQEVLGQRNREIGHVLTIVGGVTETEYHAGKGGKANYVPVPKEKQKRAVALLTEEVLKPAQIFFPESVLGKIQSSGKPEAIQSDQTRVLNSLLQENRVRRMTEAESRLGASTYTFSELLGDLRRGVFTELASPKVSVDLYRRNLQKAYVSLLAAKLDTTPAAPVQLPAGIPPALARQLLPAPISGETRAQVRGALKEIQANVKGNVSKAANPATKLHLEECLVMIDNALNPKK